MPAVIDYDLVLKTLERSGLKCVYPYSGAFGLAGGGEQYVVGWCASEDPSIRPEMRAALRVIGAPAPATLASLVVSVWQQHLTGPLWFMPASHWAYELQFGGIEWMTELLVSAGLDPEILRSRSNGSAIEFQPSEADSFSSLVRTLFDRMTPSDFTIAFPNRPVVAMLHHHQQIWWQTSDRHIWESIRALV